MMRVLHILGAVIAWLIGLAVLGIVLDFTRDFFGLPRRGAENEKGAAQPTRRKKKGCME